MNPNRLSREGVWDGSRKRTAAPNLREPSSRLAGLGKCAAQHDARYPIRGQQVRRAVAAGCCSTLPQEISSGPATVGPEKATTTDRCLERSRITP